MSTFFIVVCHRLQDETASPWLQRVLVAVSAETQHHHYTTQPAFISAIFFFRADFLSQNLPSPQTAAKLCALNHFFGRDNELQTYHGNVILMDNKHSKLL